MASKKKKKDTGAADVATPPAIFPPVEPHPDPVDGQKLLAEIEATLNTYIVFPSTAAALAVALWIMGTWVYECFSIFPRLALVSAAMRSGKSRCLDVIRALMAKPLLAASITAAVIYRTVSKYGPTLLLTPVRNFMAEIDKASAGRMKIADHTGQVLDLMDPASFVAKRGASVRSNSAELESLATQLSGLTYSYDQAYWARGHEVGRAGMEEYGGRLRQWVSNVQAAGVTYSQLKDRVELTGPSRQLLREWMK